MIYSVKQLLAYSVVLSSWDGLQKSWIKTSNRLVKQLHQKSIDSFLNVVLVKLVFQYDLQAFAQALKAGISFDYQSYTYELKGTPKQIYVKVWRVNSLDEIVTPINHRLSQSFVNTVNKKIVNNDIIDLLQAMLDKGL